MKILSIETSCDETAAAIVESVEETHVKLISQTIASSMNIHALTGGIIPEVAARNQIQYIIPVIYEALEKAGLSFDTHTAPDIDALAVTYGPGLIGSLLVGVETAKTLSYIWNKPLIPVNHLFGHIYANFIETPSRKFQPIQFPLISLIISGGHTDLLYMKNHEDIIWLGGTRDDASGEAYDKIGRLLHLPYPAGPLIEQKAKVGNPKAYHFPRPLMYDKSYDFSFSGLKTAVLREVQKINTMDETTVNNICRGVQDAISDVLVHKTLQAVKKYGVSSLLLSGGVSANQTLRDDFEKKIADEQLDVTLFAPEKFLCTDNAAMIGSAGFFRNKQIAWENISANPELYFD
jgi:N6-L-threonylcarbamoyladenine synthase